MTIAANAPVRLTYNGQAGSLWGLLSGLSADDVAGVIRSTLNNYGLYPVDVTCAVTGAVNNLIPSVTQPINGAMTLRPTYDIEESDLRDQVSFALQDATGYPASVALGTTGKPGDPDPNTQPSNIPTWLSDLIIELKKDATWIAVGGVGLVALIVVATAYGPNIKKLATL